jgi:rubrerythrin
VRRQTGSGADTAQDPEIRVLAKEFAEEESEHVAELQRWIGLHHAGMALPVEYAAKTG